MMKWPTIICDVCNKPCDKLEALDDYRTGEIVMMAYCHGDRDEMRIPQSAIIKLGKAALDQMNHGIGHAFSTKRISAKEQYEPQA